MLLPKDKESQAYLKALFAQAEEQEDLSSLLNEYLGIQEESPRLIPSFQSKEEFLSYFLSCFEGLPKQTARLARERLFPSIRFLQDVSFVQKDPYFEVLNRLSIEEGGISLHMKSVRPGELFPYSSYAPALRPFYQEKPGFAFSKTAFSYPVFSKDGRPWMSLVPHEIKTMESSIREAKGEVLTYGLGMGYFAYRCCQKEEVSRVSVVESDPAILSFFEKYLSSSFPKGKLRILKGDALSFSLGGGDPYDFLFVDIYHDAKDGLPLYLALRKKEGVAKKTSYWIEEDLLVYLRRYLVAYLEEQSDPAFLKLGDAAYQRGSDFPSLLFKGIHECLKGKKAKGKEELVNLLSDDSLRMLSKEIIF